MLFDPKWGKPDIYSLQGFIAWLEKQPANMAYDWRRISGCICCKYLDDAGQPAAVRWPLGKTLSSVFPTVKAYQDICAPKPWTAGAALERARSLEARA